MFTLKVKSLSTEYRNWENKRICNNQIKQTKQTRLGHMPPPPRTGIQKQTISGLVEQAAKATQAPPTPCSPGQMLQR